MNFENLNLIKPLLQAVNEQGYKNPSPIQCKAIPQILKGVDLLAAAQTGTGKTAAFTLPLLQRLSEMPKAKANHALALILAPTRELALQVYENVTQYSQYLKLRSTVVYGGVKINPQMMALRGGIEVLVATPGRLLDLYKQNAIRFHEIKTLILDEADRMLDMGFIHDIKRIISFLPRSRQNLLFSATFSDEIRNLAKQFLTNPVEVSVAAPNATAVKVDQVVHPVDKSQKTALLCHLIHHQNWQQALVFSRTKHGANKLVKGLTAVNVSALAIHGNKSQTQRVKALNDFKAGKIRILVATDIAARGIDIEQLPLVVNFDLPQVAHDYVHRIGRTGRAGHNGMAVSLVCADEYKQLQDIEKIINQRLKRVEIDNFEPNHRLPAKNIQAAPVKKQITRNLPKAGGSRKRRST
ncbi:DEAD/DEAH box helicase [Legionella hackeliae]|uniref:DEAD-box ATP-dependent RNA helicase RhpA n=1 Tax=Legionella hackeliae TaxID=449 RepID=A0A0A8UVR4_LEGHA|nr:DEAD/DEAH box helicase [Legionella hackeliae]KTD15468.1 ATP-dependent RNA helicase RhlE [Legionella hackeliae]CEK11162.1 ATP-dependent RNA helicase rhlE [Legionella hackeliae]STX47924.1 ATP-dependent RNA helicase RhlE [Legionella hackeliae]